MKKNRCHLCGAKLQNGYCQDCGFDVARTHRIRYRLNESGSVMNINGQSTSRKKNVQSLEEAKPISVAEKTIKLEKRNANKIQTKIPNGQKYQFVNSRQPVTKQKVYSRKRKSVKVVLIIIMLISVLTNVFVTFLENTSVHDEVIYYDNSYEEEFEEYDPYEFVTRELSEDGDEFSIILEPGEYITGAHLPEGNYTVYLEEGSGYFSVTDDENGIYLWEAFGLDDEYDEIQTMKDVRLYQSALISVSEDVLLKLSTKNAQTQNLSYLENPLKDSIDMNGGDTLIAGIDFPAGVYDAEYIDDSAWITYRIPARPDWYEEEYVEYSVWIDSYAAGGVYRNIVLPKGTAITAEDADFKLVPSEKISSEDYGSYYDFYLYE